MTEAEWLTTTDTIPIFDFLKDKVSDRKLQLFACLCCRRIWAYLHARSRKVIEILETVIEGFLTENDLETAAIEAREYMESFECRQTETGCSAAYAAHSVTKQYPTEKMVWVASRTADCVQNTFYWLAFEATPSERYNEQEREFAADEAAISEAAIQTFLLREIFGNPFRPVTISTSWLTSTVLALANGIYSEKAFDRMPILADALQDAGCENEDILNHCRQPGEHVRGCWALDLVLSRE